MTRPNPAFRKILSALSLFIGIKCGHATDLEIRPLGDSKKPNSVDVTVDSEGGGHPLTSRPGQALVFTLPPPTDGSWEKVLNVTVDDVTVPLRITRYHRQLDTLRVPVYINPFSLTDINNPQVEEIEPSKLGSETNEQNAIKYFKALYAISKISIVDGQFPARVELAYFDRALRVSADYTYISAIQQASNAVRTYVSHISSGRKRVDRLFVNDSGYRVPLLAYAQFEQWTDLFLLKSGKLKSDDDQCLLIAHYLSKIEELPSDAMNTVNAIVRFDANSWSSLQDRYKTTCKKTP